MPTQAGSPKKAALNRRIRTVLYEDQRFSETEFDLLHTPALQRLYELHQLGLTDRVFIDASHSRLQHVIGVVQQADNIMDAIISNLEKEGARKLPYGTSGETTHTAQEVAILARSKKPAVRIMAMLHDLTHAPYGHTLEDEIHLVAEKHDEPKRQADAFYRLFLQYFGWIERNETPFAWGATNSNRPADHDLAGQLDYFLDAPSSRSAPVTPQFVTYLAERWAPLLDPTAWRIGSLRKVTPAVLDRFLRALAFAIRGLLYLDIAHKGETGAKSKHLPDAEYPVESLIKQLLQLSGKQLQPEDVFLPHRDVFLLDVIGNTICADLLDYARRDSIMAGLKVDYDPVRIIGNMTVISWHTPPFIVPDTNIEYPFSYRCLRTAISVFSHKLRTDVPGELLNLLQARYFVYERMLYHPTKCVAGALLGSAVQFIGWNNLPNHLAFLGDDTFRHVVEESTRLVRDLLSTVSPVLPYTTDIANTFVQQLRVWPSTTIGKTAESILLDRLPTVGVIRRKIKALLHLPGKRAAALECESVLSDRVDSAFLDENELQKLESNCGSDQEAKGILRGVVLSCGQIVDEFRAALRLLGRLSARRFPKIVFRMLPDVEVPGLNDIDAEKIAAKFLDADIRNLAEREIEKRLNPQLPIGSIVIHCPPAQGPTKIANILITDGATDDAGMPQNAARLRDISKVSEKLFGEHEKAVRSLEKMYQSTWRLAVSVTPPHESRWKEIENVTGDVLFEILSGGDVIPSKVPNDLYLRMEIEKQLERTASTLTMEKSMPIVSEQELSVALSSGIESLVFDAVKADGRFDDLLTSNSSFDRAEFVSRLNAGQRNKATKKLSEAKTWRSERALNKFIEPYIRSAELDEQEKERYRVLKKAIIGLGGRAQRHLHDAIGRKMPLGAFSNNMSSVAVLIDLFTEAKGLDGTSEAS